MTGNVEDINMSDDHLLLQEVMERHQVTIKQLALWTGLAASTLYKYQAGDATIPTVIWRCLFERTLDPAIAKLITGVLPFIMVPLFNRGLPKINEATIETMIKTRKCQLECEKLVLAIISDKRIDESDQMAIRRYKEVFGESIMLQAAMYQAITHEYKEG